MSAVLAVARVGTAAPHMIRPGLGSGGHDVSLRWAAPEQLEEQPRPSVATDVFQLAGLLAYLVNGVAPIEGEDPEGIRRQLAAADAAVAWDGDVPQGVRALVDEAREVDATRRVVSVEQFMPRVSAAG